MKVTLCCEVFKCETFLIYSQLSIQCKTFIIYLVKSWVLFKILPIYFQILTVFGVQKFEII